MMDMFFILLTSPIGFFLFSVFLTALDIHLTMADKAVLRGMTTTFVLTSLTLLLNKRLLA